jgi:hypothetical protein
MFFRIFREKRYKITFASLVTIFLITLNATLKNNLTMKEEYDESTIEYYDESDLNRSNASVETIMIAPKYIKNQEPLLLVEGFSYENWRESELISRVLTKKNHQDFMNLVEIAVKIFNLNSIEYMLGNDIFFIKRFKTNNFIYLP